jgi:deoxyribonuclease V
VARVSIAILDVDYRGTGARAACVVAADWTSEAPSATFVCDIESVHDYEPGAFYRRELPCLLQVLGLLPAMPDVVVIDGYVWLSDEPRPGLGAHLYQALGSSVPVAGVAKTAFHGADACPLVMQVHRGSSQKPLFVTSVGVEPDLAGSWVKGMAGPHRIPTLLTATDQLSRSGESRQNAT